MSKKTYIEVKKISDNVGGKPTCGFSLQHNTFSALDYAQDFGTTVKESLKRTTSSRNFTTNVPKILVLKSSSEQIFSRKLPLGALVPLVQSVIEFTN